jgi:hypothetical protein
MSNQNEALNELLQRFAISALSRERKDEALNEEILVGKYTGEFYIKTKDGIVMSTDVLNRSNASMNEAIRIAELMGMTDEIFKVEFDGMMLPNYIDYGVNFIQNDHISLPEKTKEFLLYLDLDEYIMIDDHLEIIHTECDVKITLEVTIGEKVTTKVIKNNVKDINYFIIPIDEFDESAIVKITSIKINEDINADPKEDRVMLLHNMFLTINN